MTIRDPWPQYVGPPQQPCPTCGHCPTCGRSNWAQPYRVWYGNSTTDFTGGWWDGDTITTQVTWTPVNDDEAGDE